RSLPDDPGAGGGAGASDRGRSAEAAAAAPHEPRARLSEGAAGAGRVLARRTDAGSADPRPLSSFVEIAQLGKTYETSAGPAVIVRNFTLYVGDGEFVSLLGHVGC